MKLNKTIAVLSMTVALAGQAHANQVYDVQSMLQQLGYNVGVVDGAYGRKTKGALEKFYAKSGGSFDGKLDANEVADLTVALSSGSSNKVNFSSGIEYENQGSMIFPKTDIDIVKPRYWWQNPPVINDFNGDGINDILITGVKQNQGDQEVNALHTGDICGSKGYCKGSGAMPSMFLGTKSGKFVLEDDMMVDNRKKPGHSLARQNLVADFNGDGKLDVYLADHGIGNHNGYRDSYFLSQPNGTLLESSASHLDRKGQSTAFNHGAATGDIDGDGDMDIVWSIMGKFVCLMNNGTGKMKSKTCGNVSAFGMELADIDGDGDLDMIHGAHEFESHTQTRTGVAFNNGRGHFSKGSIKLPTVDGWGVIPEVSAWDIDKDGDMDIVISRAGKAYVGVAVQVLENLGNKKFNSSVYELVVAPEGFDSKSEGNPYNAFIQSIRFADADADGDTDILLFSNGNPKVPQGSFLRNNGDMNMTYVKAGKNSILKLTKDSQYKK